MVNFELSVPEKVIFGKEKFHKELIKAERELIKFKKELSERLDRMDDIPVLEKIGD